MGVKAVGAVRWLLVLLIAVAIACDDEPAPTSAPTPTSTPMAMPEPTSIPTPTYGTEACNLMDTPYDTLATASAPGGEKWRWEMRESGPDSHTEATVTDNEGVLLAKYESITKDRTKYYRESMPGAPDVYGEWSVVGTDLRQSFPLPCLNPASFEEGASALSDEAHFTSERFLSEQEGAERNEFWADSTGRPTRARRTVFPPEYDGISNTDTSVIEFTYSEYGESNIIAAPCAGAAPDQANNPALMRDCTNLLGLKDTLQGTVALNWGLGTIIARWTGVTTAGAPARVTKVELPGKGLTGSIPMGLWHLSALTHLDLSSNSLTGDIPNSLEHLTNLESIMLSGNALTGCIPSSLRDVATNDLDSLGLLDCASDGA